MDYKIKKVFWENPYQSKLDTTVLDIDGDQILFKETIIFSFSGGQESDKATVNGVPIIGSKIIDKLIYYTISEPHQFKIGDVVKLEIDWPRRYRLMRLHFTAELILEIVSQKFNLEKVGAHISELKSRIDFRFNENISQYFNEILEIYNKIIDQDLPIFKDFSDIDNERRFWKIEGFAQVPCGGTHVNTTKEVGYVSLKRDKPGKGIERIEIRLVDDLLGLPKNHES